MRYATLGLTACSLCVLFGLTVSSQPPGPGPGGKKPGRFQIGSVMPPPIKDALQLTPQQQQQIADLEKEVRERLRKILTEEQLQRIERLPPRPDGPPPREKDEPPPPRGGADVAAPVLGLIANAQLTKVDAAGKGPADFTLTGDVLHGQLGNPRADAIGWGIRLLSDRDEDRDGSISGSVTHTVTGLRSADGRWFRFRIRGLAQEGFRVDDDALLLKVEFFADQGKNALDSVTKKIYGQIERERRDLQDPRHTLGREGWRSYDLELRTPFPEVDTLRLSVAFAKGSGKGPRAEFWLDEFSLTRIPVPTDYRSPQAAKGKPAALAGLTPLGGRWYYDPRGGSKEPPQQFDHTNSDRLCYLTDRLEAPFADNMAAWLRRGYLDRSGQLSEQDRFVPNNLVVSFTDTHLVMRSKNLPNHPTAQFPDRLRIADGNPHHIQEQNYVWHIPLHPKVNPNPAAMANNTNLNRALPMGPIGVAVNGVIFFNPFDMSQSEDALPRLDRCCGHPSPGNQYHYHKYPVCVKSPWTDDGAEHSPVIGFAFDGFPICGPYEKAGVMAKDLKENPLSAFNIHHDEARGWHYHVTPGRFPHVIGGYWGHVEPMNLRKGPR